MKSLYSFLITVLLVLTLSIGNCESVDLEQFSDEELALLMDRISIELQERKIRAIEEVEMTIDNFEFDDDVFHYKSMGHEVVTDSDGFPVLLIMYEVTNNGERTSSEHLGFIAEVNRKTLDPSTDDVAMKNRNRFAGKLEPGESVIVTKAYELSKDDKLVDIHIYGNNMNNLFDTSLIIE